MFSLASPGAATSLPSLRLACPSASALPPRPPHPPPRSPAVARSDGDTVVRQSIPFCSFNCHELTEVTASKDFDPGRMGDFQALVVAKCQSCSVKTDMCDACQCNRSAQEILLNQLIAIFDHPNLVRKLDQKCLESIFALITSFISREIPLIKVLPATFLCERSELFCDTAWPLLSLAYKLLSGVIVSSHVPPNAISPHVSSQFLGLLFRCLSSPDSRERQQIKLILFAVSARLPDRAHLIAGFISKSFIDSIFNEPITFGLAQLFELFGHLIQSIPIFASSTFDVALRQQFFPLHLSSEYLRYSPQLTACVMALLARNPRNVDDLILFLLRHFPCASQQKQVQFLDEIASVVERFWEALAPRTARILFERLSRLYPSTCAEISEKSLGLVYAPGFAQLLKQYYLTLAPVLIERALEVSKGHWNYASSAMAFSLLQELSRLDRQNFVKIQSQIGKVTSLEDEEQQRAIAWDQIAHGTFMPVRPSTSRTEHLKVVAPIHRTAIATSGRPTAKLPILPMSRPRVRK
jgi:hypothetical protein